MNIYFEIYAGTSGFTFLQNIIDGSQPIAIFISLDNSVEFFGDLDIPNFYNKAEIDAIGDELSSLILNIYMKTEVENLITSIDLTGSENIGITSNQISLTYLFELIMKPFLNPRVNCYFEMYASPNSISILQHISDGSQPIAIFNSLDKSVEFFGGLDIPYFYNETEVGNLITNVNVVNYFIKNQVGALIYNINLVDYYTKTEIDTQLAEYTTIAYLQAGYMTPMPKAGTLMNNCATIALLVDNFYDKAYLDNQFSLKADVSQLTGLVSTDYLDLKYTNSVDLFTNHYNKIEIGNLLANKVSTTGDASISSNLTINGNLDSSKKFPLDIKSSTIHTEFWTLASFHQGIENSGSWLQFSRDGTSNTWQAGMSSDNSYVIRASDATDSLIVNQNGNTTISGNLDVGGIMDTTKINFNK